MPKSRAEEGRVQNPRLAERPGSSRKIDPQVVLPKVVYDLLSSLERSLPEAPDAARVDFRDLKAQLRGAFPRLFLVNASELAQQLAEEDGDAFD